MSTAHKHNIYGYTWENHGRDSVRYTVEIFISGLTDDHARYFIWAEISHHVSIAVRSSAANFIDNYEF
jgi:hypothetical protein